uniref:Ig-like domain-containing protein n=1 Tax=Crocodylus porosus TaxID=8502 RepID=A0A7M4FY61_CROPO
ARPPPALFLWPCCLSQGYNAVESREEGDTLSGETLSVQCPYNQQQYREAVKVWYQLRGGTYYQLASTQYTPLGGYQKEASLERTTIQDDNSKGTVTITIKRLQLQDAGVYMCGFSPLSLTVHVPLTPLSHLTQEPGLDHKGAEGFSPEAAGAFSVTVLHSSLQPPKLLLRFLSKQAPMKDVFHIFVQLHPNSAVSLVKDITLRLLQTDYMLSP